MVLAELQNIARQKQSCCVTFCCRFHHSSLLCCDVFKRANVFSESHGWTLLHHISQRWSSCMQILPFLPKMFYVTWWNVCVFALLSVVHMQINQEKDYFTLTCNTSCPVADPHTSFRWYWNRMLFEQCESQDLTVFRLFAHMSCAVKSNEYLISDELCEYDPTCRKVKTVFLLFLFIFVLS